MRRHLRTSSADLLAEQLPRPPGAWLVGGGGGGLAAATAPFGHVSVVRLSCTVRNARKGGSCRASSPRLRGARDDRGPRRCSLRAALVAPQWHRGGRGNDTFFFIHGLAPPGTGAGAFPRFVCAPREIYPPSYRTKLQLLLRARQLSVRVVATRLPREYKPAHRGSSSMDLSLTLSEETRNTTARS